MSSSSTDLSDAPLENIFEVNVFGPGKGECIAVHSGAGDWIVVDSCTDQLDARHPALEYFQRIGLDVASRVHLVVGTHSHDDHIAGMADLYKRCHAARFVCSSALTSEEFFALIEADADVERVLRQSVRSEYRGIFAEVERRGIHEGRSSGLRAVEGRTLWERAAGTLPGAEVRALSPSDHAVSRALKRLAQGTAVVGQRRHLSASDPNELAVAVRVDYGPSSVLLGADLLQGPAGCGWSAALTLSGNRLASLIKVPHHGDPGADHPGVWQEMLGPDPLAILAPYRAGRKPRPAPEDVARLKAKTAALYATADSQLHAQTKRTKQTAAALAGLASNVREPWGRSGHVRARLHPGATEWSVEVSSPALRL